MATITWPGYFCSTLNVNLSWRGFFQTHFLAVDVNMAERLLRTWQMRKSPYVQSFKPALATQEMTGSYIKYNIYNSNNNSNIKYYFTYTSSVLHNETNFSYFQNFPGPACHDHSLQQHNNLNPVTIATWPFVLLLYSSNVQFSIFCFAVARQYHLWSKTDLLEVII